jgi:hypothetical protein
VEHNIKGKERDEIKKERKKNYCVRSIGKQDIMHNQGRLYSFFTRNHDKVSVD